MEYIIIYNTNKHMKGTTLQLRVNTNNIYSVLFRAVATCDLLGPRVIIGPKASGRKPRGGGTIKRWK